MEEKTLNASFVRDEDERLKKAYKKFSHGILVISLTGVDDEVVDGQMRTKICRKIVEACKDWGIFQVVDHVVDMGLISDITRLVREFFALLAHLKSAVEMNGFACKPNFNASDFFFGGLANPGNTNNLMGSNITAANVLQIPGLNTLGVSMTRVDFAPNGGLNPPHFHQRASEIIYVVYGELDVGFITTADVLVSKSIKQGDVFVFPKGLVHFQQNNGKSPATMIARFNSQFPGIQVIAQALFAATPPVLDDVLSRAFQISNQEVDQIKSRLATPMS